MKLIKKICKFIRDAFFLAHVFTRGILIALFFGLVEYLTYLEMRKEARKRGLPEPEEDYFDCP